MIIAGAGYPGGYFFTGAGTSPALLAESAIQQAEALAERSRLVITPEEFRASPIVIGL